MIWQNYLGIHRRHLVPVHFDPLRHEEGTILAPDPLGEIIADRFLQREETERFRKIDAKRGGRGFV